MRKKSKIARAIAFRLGTECDNIANLGGKARCCNCGRAFKWDEYDCDIYRGKALCACCFDNEFGYCNECGELNRYSDMDDDICCKICHDYLLKTESENA